MCLSDSPTPTVIQLILQLSIQVWHQVINLSLDQQHYQRLLQHLHLLMQLIPTHNAYCKSRRNRFTCTCHTCYHKDLISRFNSSSGTTSAKVALKLIFTCECYSEERNSAEMQISNGEVYNNIAELDGTLSTACG